MSFKVEKGVPLPSTKSKGVQYPFESMAVGDSFYVPLPPGRTIHWLQGNLSSCAHSYGRTHPGFKAITRTDKGNKGCRVWRVPVVSLMAEPEPVKAPPTVRIHLIADDDEPMRAKGGRR